MISFSSFGLRFFYFGNLFLFSGWKIFAVNWCFRKLVDGIIRLKLVFLVINLFFSILLELKIL